MLETVVLPLSCLDSAQRSHTYSRLARRQPLAIVWRRGSHLYHDTNGTSNFSSVQQAVAGMVELCICEVPHQLPLSATSRER